jgi:hypothetical protein
MPSAREIARNLPGYFKLDDLRGDKINVTIRTAGLEEVGPEKDIKMVLSFLETPKKVVVNVCRSDQLTALFGDDELVGQKVSLCVDMVKGSNNRTSEQIVIGAAE